MPRALIIGHSGQDGRILWDQLVVRDFSLIGISRYKTRTHLAQWEGIVDITDLACVRDLIHAFRPDQIYYLAAHHHSSEESSGNKALAWNESWIINVHAFSHFLLVAKISCPGTRIFYASSSRVFGEASVSPQNESIPLKPSCIYGVTKASAMLLADYYVRTHDVFVSCGILFNHESPLRGAQFVSQRVADGLVALKYAGATSMEIGSLDARVDWGYAPDYTRAMQLILDAETAENFVIASGETHSVRDMIIVAADYLDLAWEGRVVETNRILRRRPQELCGDASRLRRTTGWTPHTSFHSMTEILIDGALARYHKRPSSIQF